MSIQQDDKIGEYITEKEVGKMPEETITMKKYSCSRCSHQWLPRKDEAPETCPRCHSPYWNKPRENAA